jgi:hypothetical protein
MGGMKMSMSMMFLNWNTDCSFFIFEAFHATTLSQFAFGCFVVIAFCAATQFMLLPQFRKIMVGNDQTADKSEGHMTFLPPYAFESDRNKMSEKSDEL